MLPIHVLTSTYMHSFLLLFLFTIGEEYDLISRIVVTENLHATLKCDTRGQKRSVVIILEHIPTCQRMKINDAEEG